MRAPVFTMDSTSAGRRIEAPLHPAQRRYLAEDLVRRRRSDEQRRYAAPQRAAKIDANPHQIDAVIFALSRLREGGCLLADEVGLGKTIEAGLVMAQLLAEGARRVLLVTPKPLLGQWRQELFQLFGLETREGRPWLGGFDGDGIFLVGRETAGSERGREALLASGPFDLCVIDEAHEVFAGIYKRFDEMGQYKEDAGYAQTAGRIRDVLITGNTPVLLLTATPIQNNLAELWGLVQYVDPLGTLLGDLATFREVFCRVDDRQIAPGQEEELRNRLQSVLKRTLRRQAQEFLEKPFVERQARLFEYTMSPAERALYDDVTRYLLEPGILAFRGSQRQLALLGYHRRMASSSRALAVSLQKIVARLRAELANADPDEADDLASDLEDDELATHEGNAGNDSSIPRATPDALKAEIARVEGFVLRADALQGDDSRFRALLQALTFVLERARTGKGAGKLVIFTESCVTQEYLRDRLVESKLVTDAEITLFRGVNDSPRALQALARWRETTPPGTHDATSADIAVRLALVHEFRTRSRVLIATEAGGKGLNLQFCDTVVNYDLPWNPQRIEQRIGRCHRYGQRHDVTVINFLAKDNEAQQLTFELLSQKLELFGAVLDASDHVLHRPDGEGGSGLVDALGTEFEAQIRKIYARARTIEERDEAFRALREKVMEDRRRFQETRARTVSLIEKSFDETVRRVFRSHQETVRRALAELDRDLLTTVLGYLDAKGISYERVAGGAEDLLHVAPSLRLPGELQAGVTAAVGTSSEHRSLHPSHPLVLAAVNAARAAGGLMSALVELSNDAPEALRGHAGKRGTLRVIKLSFEGFEQMDLLVPVLVLESGEVVDATVGEAVLRGRLRQVGPIDPVIDEDTLSDAAEEVLTSVQIAVDAAEHQRFQRASHQAVRFVDDRLLVFKRRRSEAEARVEQAELRRDGVTGSAARTEAERALVAAQKRLEEIEAMIERLENRDDDTFRRYQEHILKRRYTPPRREHLFDLALQIEHSTEEGRQA